MNPCEAWSGKIRRLKHNFLFLIFWDAKKDTFFVPQNQGWGAGAGCFWLLGAEARAAWKKNKEPEPFKKKQGAGARAAWEKILEPEPLEKKSGARAA